MPNYVKTVVKFKNLKSKADIDTIVAMIAKDDAPAVMIDFNKIIPQPETKEECPKEYLRTIDSHIAPQPDKPWLDWYKWNCDNWGTKWSACGEYSVIGEHDITFVFETAWSFAEPIVNRLALLGFNLDIRFADEDWGNNYGKLSYNIKTGWANKTDTIVNPYNWAKALWKKY